jgi:hypothetical protein
MKTPGTSELSQPDKPQVKAEIMTGKFLEAISKVS